jgi:hypothetical protein
MTSIAILKILNSFFLMLLQERDECNKSIFTGHKPAEKVAAEN